MKIMEKLFSRLNAKGQEVPDPTPAAVPLGYKNPPTLEERIRSMISVQLSSHAAQDGMESFEEANDFNVGDDLDPHYPEEDEQFAINDPHLQKAAEARSRELRSKMAPEGRKGKGVASTPAPAESRPKGDSESFKANQADDSDE